jgi:hypothetical protein
MKVNWTAIAVVSIALVFVLLVGISVVSRFSTYGAYRGWGMMGPRMMGGWGFAPLGWIRMLAMWLFPLGFLVLLVLGITWLVKAISRPGSGQLPAAPAKACPECYRPVQADWRNCPYCGTALGQDI